MSDKGANGRTSDLSAASIKNEMARARFRAGERSRAPGWEGEMGAPQNYPPRTARPHPSALAASAKEMTVPKEFNLRGPCKPNEAFIGSTSGFADRGSLALDGVPPLAHHSRRATDGPVATRGSFWQVAARAYALPDIRLLSQDFSNAAGGVAVSDASSRAFEARLGRFSGSRDCPLSFAA